MVPLRKSRMDGGASKRFERTRRLWWRVQRRVWCFGYTKRVGIGRALRARVGCNVIATDKRGLSMARRLRFTVLARSRGELRWRSSRGADKPASRGAKRAAAIL